ncbi:MAG: host attachment protein [Alphaproteobacteria bacterium]
MKKHKTWVLVADGARARILHNDGPGKGLSDSMNHGFAATHAPSRSFGTDKPGRGFASVGKSRHAKVPRIDFHTFEKQRFARDVAAVIDAAEAKGAFDRLVLVAPAKTLGELRKSMGAASLSKVTAELGKDLTHVPVNDLEGHLNKVMLL